MTEHVEAIAYIEVRATRATWVHGKPINGAKIEKVTKGRPNRIDGDSIVLKLAVKVPRGIFERLATVNVLIPEGAAAGDAELEATFDEGATLAARARSDDEEGSA